LLSAITAGVGVGAILGVAKVGATVGMLIGAGANSLRSLIMAERTARGRISLYDFFFFIGVTPVLVVMILTGL